MARIDLSQFEGYSEMSAEEKLALLEAYEYDDKSGEVEKYKKSFDKASSDLADVKKQLKAKMSDDEVKAKESADAFDELKAKYDEVIARENFRNVTTEYMELGYSKELAEATAKADIEGDRATVLANRKSFLESIRNGAKSEFMRSIGRPENGDGTKTITKEQFNKMGFEEAMKLKNENPDLYNELKNKE